MNTKKKIVDKKSISTPKRSSKAILPKVTSKQAMETAAGKTGEGMGFFTRIISLQ